MEKKTKFKLIGLGIFMIIITPILCHLLRVNAEFSDGELFATGMVFGITGAALAIGGAVSMIEG